MYKLIRSVIPLIQSLLQNAKTETPQAGDDNEGREHLRSFMLGGMYFIHGWGGYATVEEWITEERGTSDKQRIEGYKDYLVFPFNRGEDYPGEILAEWWGIHDRPELLVTLDNLKNRDHPYKAWDYARLVNNACQGYAAEYLSKSEAIHIINDVLPLAQARFKTWEDYLADYTLGRKDWDPEAGSGEAYETLARQLVEEERSIYNLIPLQSR